MSKDAYYFSHDSNARHDPKITAMRGVYGSEGYGWYWMLVEMMRESNDYKLDMQSKYAFNAFALQLHSDSKRIEEFVRDCIDEFSLFASDGQYFWSESLLKRMKIRESKSEKARQSAKKRWDKKQKDANEMRTHKDDNANAQEIDASKGKESKENKNKEKKIINNNQPNPFNFFEQNGYGTISPILTEDINCWIDGTYFDEPEEIIIQAMKEGVSNNKRTWSYVNRILIDWSNRGLRTLKDVEAAKKEFDAKKGYKNPSSSQSRRNDSSVRNYQAEIEAALQEDAKKWGIER